MTRNALIGTVAAIAVAAGLVGLAVWRHGQAPAEAKDVDPTATITTAVVGSQGVSQVIALYGEVQADPSATIGVAAPRAIIVSRVLVRVGQQVAAGQALIELAGAPEAELAYHQATDAVTFAQADLARVQRLFDEKLAANDQLGAAKKALAEAQAQLASVQKQRGAGPTQTLTAPRAAIVTKIAANPGDHVAQDGALLNLAGSDGLVVQLGLEPTERRIAVGQAVTLKPAGGGAGVASRISLVAKAPNPDSKLLTATAPLPGSALAVGAAVEGDIAIGAHAGLTVPRAAVVFDETGSHVFTVAGGKAHRVFVTVGADQGEAVEVSGPIKAGDAVAVEGAYELQDGMAVKLKGAKPAKAAAKDEDDLP
jgi:membrane fusion protein (multidrug efflux system)